MMPRYVFLAFSLSCVPSGKCLILPLDTINNKKFDSDLFSCYFAMLENVQEQPLGVVIKETCYRKAPGMCPFSSKVADLPQQI